MMPLAKVHENWSDRMSYCQISYEIFYSISNRNNCTSQQKKKKIRF